MRVPHSLLTIAVVCIPSLAADRPPGKFCLHFSGDNQYVEIPSAADLSVGANGLVASLAGGWLFNEFGHAGVTGLNLYSLLVAVVGAVLLLVIYHAIRRRR